MALALITLGLLPLISSGCLSRKSMIERSRNSVVSLTTRFVKTGLPVTEDTRTGSGFFVDRRTVVTALHVVDALKKTLVDYPEGHAQIYVERQHPDGLLSFSVKAQMISFDDKNDLAILAIEGDTLDAFFENGSLTALTLADSQSEIGEEVVLSGYRGQEAMPFTSFGYVSLLSRDPNPKGDLPEDVVYADLTTLSGNSGSAIVSMRTGKVVGVQLGFLNLAKAGSGMSYAAGLDALKGILAAAENVR